MDIIKNVAECFKIKIAVIANWTFGVNFHFKSHVPTSRYSHHEFILELYQFIVFREAAVELFKNICPVNILAIQS